MKKKLVWIFGGLGVALLVGGYVLLSSTGRIVKYAIEEYGPAILGVNVEVGSVLILPWMGKGSVHGLQIGSPKGYQAPYVFKVKSAEMQIDLKSLLSNSIRIPSIVVDSPEITWEGSLERSNFTELQRNVEKYTGKGSSSAEKNIQIALFKVQGAKVDARVAGMNPLRFTLDDIVIHNLNSRNKAEAAQKIVSVIVGQIGQKIITEIMKSPEFLSKAQNAVEGILGGVKSLFGK